MAVLQNTEFSSFLQILPDSPDRIKAYEQVGMTRFILIFLDPEDAEWFARDVMPKLRG